MSGSHSVRPAESASALSSQCIQLPWPPCSSTSGGRLASEPKRRQRTRTPSCTAS